MSELNNFWIWIEQKNPYEIRNGEKILKFRTIRNLSKSKIEKCIEVEYITLDNFQLIAIFTYDKQITRGYSYRKNNTHHIIKSCISISTIEEILQYFFSDFPEIKEPETE